jgi:NAD(P)H-flavin reductase
VDELIYLNVADITALSQDVFRASLIPQSGQLPRFHAGQYLKLVMPDGRLKPYSISSAPESGVIELQLLASRRTDGGSTVVQLLQAHPTVPCQMPFGACRLPDNARPLLMITGGTGISPMKAIIDSSIARGETRAIWLYWGVEQASFLYLHEELADLSRTHDRILYKPVVAKPTPDWTGYTGHPHAVARHEHADLRPFEIYCSGSEQMARAVHADFLSQGIDAGQFHCDWIDILRDERGRVE